MENNTKQADRKNWTSRKLVFYTVLPATLVGIITMMLIPHYEETYNITYTEYRLIWQAIRNLFNVLMILMFILINIILLIKWKLGKKHVSYVIFIIHFLISLSLLNFSYFPTVELLGVIKGSIHSLPSAMNFEYLKK